MPSILRVVRAVGLLSLVAILAHPGDSVAQPKALTGFPTPTLTVLGPAGGKAGSSVEVAITGLNLAKPTGLLLDGKPVSVEWLPGTPTDPKKGGTMQPPKQGQPNTQTIHAKFEVPASTSIGLHDLRFVGHWGVSNPRAFAVGDQTEVQEKEPNNDVDQAQDVPLGCTINGVISTPTDVDYYRFEGKKGQRVVLACLASSIDSRLTPSIQLYTANGSPLGFARDYRGNDAVLDAVLPADGAYLVRVFAFTYTQGGPEHFYRLTISTAPWIDAVFPPMVEPGKTTTVTVYGRNLPGGQPDPAARIDGRVLDKLTVKVDAPADGMAQQRLDVHDHIAPHMAAVDGFTLRLKNAAGTSNPYLLQYATAPVVLEQGDNDRPEQAQVVTVPCEIAGRIEKIRDRDWYRFAAKKGEPLSIEIYGDRLGSPVDMYMTLKSADGKTITEQDDNPDLLHPLAFYSKTEDPQRYRFVPPADGDYLLLVSSREADIQAGPRSLYRVRIGSETPDFRIVLQPPSLNSPDETALRAGTAVAFHLMIAPRDGFNAPLTLEARGLPDGVTLGTTSIPAGARLASVAFSARPDAKEWAGTFTLLAKATVGGKELVREVRAGSIVWAVPQQQNVPTISRLARECVLAVREAPPFKVELTTTKLILQPGDSAELPVKVVALDKEFAGQVQIGPVQLQGNPGNAPFLFNNNGEVSLAPGGEAKPKVQAGNNAQPGVYTLQLRGQTTMSLIINPDTGEKGRGVIPIPAVPVQVLILPRQLVQPRLGDPNNIRVKMGEKLDLPIKIERSSVFNGPVEVELVVPQSERGLSGTKMTLAADKDEAIVSLTAAAGTQTGQHSGLLVRLTCEMEGKKFTQEVKLMVNVLK
jgi:hypothetical protein